ncbi:MAG: hypothetical protein NVS4B2_23530 [Chloroflexota bacterium]
MTTTNFLEAMTLTAKTQTSKEVLALAERFALKHAGNRRPREMLETALVGLRAHVRSTELQSFVSPPLLVDAAVRGNVAPRMQKHKSQSTQSLFYEERSTAYCFSEKGGDR